MANIVHFGKFFFPDTGGIESVTLSLAKGAAREGHNITVVCFQKKKSEGFEIVEGISVVRAPITKILASQPLGFKYFWECILASKKADIVHMHAPNMLAALCALFIPEKTRLLVHWHSDVLNKGILGFLFRPLESALLRRANCIVATSQIYADASKSLMPFRHKTTVVPIGVSDVTQLGNASRLPLAIEERVSGRRIILAVGRLVAYKGFNVLIEAARYLTEKSVVVIVGNGPLLQDLQLAIDRGGVNDRVFLAGRLSDTALHALFEGATLYCLPSINRAEAFGVVLLEAMSHGLPVVASDIPGSAVPWINQHGHSGLNVPVSNPGALANACNLILESEELRDSLSLSARQRFLAEFTEEVSVKRMMFTYMQLTST